MLKSQLLRSADSSEHCRCCRNCRIREVYFAFRMTHPADEIPVRGCKGFFPFCEDAHIPSEARSACGGRYRCIGFDEDIEQLFSRFAAPKSEESRLESLADPSSFAGLDENNPSSVARWMKKMGKELGEDFGGEDIDQLAEEAAQETAGGGPSGNDSGGASSDEL